MLAVGVELRERGVVSGVAALAAASFRLGVAFGAASAFCFLGVVALVEADDVDDDDRVGAGMLGLDVGGDTFMQDVAMLHAVEQQLQFSIDTNTTKSRDAVIIATFPKISLVFASPNLKIVVSFCITSSIAFI